MNSKSVLLSLVVLSFSLPILSKTNAPSSEIPAKREFPLNPAINPCDDLYGYACSKVIESFKLRPDRAMHVFSFSDSSERILNFKKKYFVSLSKIEPQNKKEEMLKNTYVACMNAESSAIDERNHVKTTLKNLSYLKNKEDLFSFLAKRMTLPDAGSVRFENIPNQDNPTVWDILLVTPYMTAPEKSYYEKAEYIQDDLKLKEKFFREIKEADPKAAAKVVSDLERDLAKVFPTPVEIRDRVSQNFYMSREDFLKKYPHLKLDVFFSRVPSTVKVRNLMPEAFEMLNKKLEEMSLQDLKRVYVYFALGEMLDDSAPSYIQARVDFKAKHLGGPKKRAVRAERCTKLAMNQFARELDFILIPQIFPHFPTETVTALSEKIRSSILASLNENKWLSAQGKKEAINKMKNARLQLVQPETEKDWNFNYEGDYKPNTRVQNSIQYGTLSLQKDLDQLSQPTLSTVWDMSPLTVNAYYTPSYNKFVLPISILQYPFFSADQPMEVNLAAIGTVIGHELGHGIDDQGSKYDQQGQLRRWLTDSDLKKFTDLTKPLVDQFGKIGHNGSLTLGENIGDLVGLSASYRAAFPNGYQEKDKKLNQDFFVQYARAWCETQTASMQERRLKSDPHALGMARANEQMKHQPAFSKAFSCKAGDKLVLPENEMVKIW